MPSIADIRKDYKLKSLLETDVATDPVNQFGRWWNEALQSELEEVNAMTLSTVTASGRPTARIVLLKDYSNEGFVFYTNYESDKAKAMEANPYAALVFFWAPLERQVRIEGFVEKVSAEESDAYFLSRPAGSRIGAWASPQSSVISNRTVVEEKVEALTAKFSDGNIPRPPHWGGYIVKPYRVEFWQGRPNRLHDRICYLLSEDGKWTKERLAP